MTEMRLVLKNAGIVDPRRLATYLDVGGFSALRKITAGMSPDEVITEVKDSGLRGRGGAGFPSGLKWQLARAAPGKEKFVICNADEGEVGTFKDRYILENDPFSLLEGIAIAGYAISATAGYIYLRAEYHFLLENLRLVLEQVNAAGLTNDFPIFIRLGAGAYVCGEESALMESIEGGRGEVRYKPPFPPSEGLWKQPTIIDNVETLMNIPRIMENGAAWFQQIGTEKSKGTKVFSVSGDVARPGVYELVMGSSLRELVVDIAGASDVKMVQAGGSTGRLVPGDRLDVPLTFESVLGAGAITVLDNSRDIIDALHCNMEFLAEESCGKCTPCREGTRAMAMILAAFVRGEGNEKDIIALRRLGSAMSLAALCGLGQAAAIPVSDSLEYFPEEYTRRMKTASVEVKQ
jgi:NADH-quinone oxidoreductase subunit F